MSISEDAVREQLKKVIDPELFVNIVDLGLVYVVNIGEADDNQKQPVDIEMTLTSPMCPAGPQLVGAPSSTWIIPRQTVREASCNAAL